MDFYYNSICHVCKEFKNNLKRCSSCKHIAYCSKEHQVSDWKNHKEICKVLSDIIKFITLEKNCGYVRWRSYRTRLQFCLENRMKRKLKPYESQMWMFPRNCAVCYSLQNLKDCPRCLCVAYCSLEHKILNKEKHELHCPELQLCLDYDRFSITNTGVNFHLSEFYNVDNLPQTIHECIDMILNSCDGVTYLHRVYLTDIFASLLTILFGLEKCNILINRGAHTGKLVIHMVGADITELSLNWKYMINFLQLWIRNFRMCKFILVGPDCQIGANDLNSFSNIKVECIQNFYHNVVNKLECPDMIVALNSGLHEFESSVTDDTWRKSLSKLIINEAPLLLTSYTKNELEKDLARLLHFNPKIILNVSRNPFSHIRPIRDWDSEENAPFYINAYMAIIAGEKYGES